MKCNACHKELNKKELLFTVDKEAYCINPFTCNDNHPNSVPNIVARGGAETLYTEDQLESNLFENLQVSDEMKDRIQKVATKPQSIRLNKVDIAHYLILLQEQKEFSSISEAVRYCVSKTMEIEPLDVPGPSIINGEPKFGVVSTLAPEPVEVKKEIEYPLPSDEEEEFEF